MATVPSETRITERCTACEGYLIRLTSHLEEIVACAGPGHACNAEETAARTDNSAAAPWEAKEACVQIQLGREQQLASRSAGTLRKALSRCQACAAC